jgi:hypothetical protein
MIDLDLAVTEVVDEDGGVTSGREGRGGVVKRRASPTGYAQEKVVVFEASEGGALEEDDGVKHYDADGACRYGNLSRPSMFFFSDTFSLFFSFWLFSVLTKVVVYVGIGILATSLVPAMFEALGWGV